jgi:hypothetical protein
MFTAPVGRRIEEATDASGQVFSYANHRSHWSLLVLLNKRVGGKLVPSALLHLDSLPSFYKGVEKFVQK